VSDNFVELTPQPDNFDPSEIECLIQEVDNQPVHLSIVAYGVSGIGKTRFGATGSKCLVVNCGEQKPISIRGMGAKVINIRKVPDDLEKVFWYLRNGGHKNFDTLVIDGVSSMQKMLQRYVVAENCKLNATKNKILTSQRDYGEVGDYLTTWIMNFRNLQDVMDVVFLALERGPDEKNELYRPDVIPSVQRMLESSVNIVGRMYYKDVVSKGKELTVPSLYVAPHAEYMTKDCTGCLGKEILQPSIPKILKKINENYNK